MVARDKSSLRLELSFLTWLHAVIATERVRPDCALSFVRHTEAFKHLGKGVSGYKFEGRRWQDICVGRTTIQEDVTKRLVACEGR